MSDQNTLDFKAFRERIGDLRGKEYWRSLEELARSDAFDEFFEEEFPRQAAALNHSGDKGVDRRNFIKLMGASVAAAGLAACRQPEQSIIPYVKQPENLIPGKPMYFASAFVLGGYAQGILVESHEFHPTKIEGNPDHPASLGASDAFMQAHILNLYDPDRSQVVRKLGDTSTWSEFIAALQPILAAAKTNGAGLRLLTGTITSPTLGAQIQQLLTLYPGMKWHQWEPVNRDNAREGARMAFGSYVDVHYDLTKANVVVTLGSDFLDEGPGHLRYARDFASRRRVRQGATSMNRLYAIETSYTSTGSIADHRLRIKPSQMEAFARALMGGAPAPSPAQDWIAAVSRDLQANAGKSVVIAGDDQPAIVHAIAHAINSQLGNIGSTVLITDSAEVAPVNQLESIRQLTTDMHNGAVKALIILGGNPVFDAPADFNFRTALDKVPFRAHLGHYYNETAMLSHWHLPEVHDLETWGDARAHDGTVSIIQPLIAPLYNGRAAIEVLGALIGGLDQSPYDAVRAYWFSKGATDANWKKWLHDGLIQGSAFPVRTASAAAPPATQQPSNPGVAGLELEIRHDPTLYDGRFANNAWLQELPKPQSKIVWDNVLLLSPKTADKYGVRPSDDDVNEKRTIVTDVEYRGITTQIPVWVIPGHADDVATIFFGFNPQSRFKVANGAGVNTYPLRLSDALYGGPGVKISKSNRPIYPIACTQEHQSIDPKVIGERGIIKAATFVEYQHDPHFAHEERDEKTTREEADATMYEQYPYDPPAYRWAMSIDTSVCTGCNGCVIACVSENNISIVGKEEVHREREMHWLRIDRYYKGSPDNPEVYHQPVPCMQCEQAPCEPVCPVEATSHSSDGLNDMTYNRCVGTRYCSNNCPYKVRRFNFFHYADYDTPSLKPMRNPDVSIRTRGVMEKCTYCVQRLTEAKINAEREDRRVRDGEVTTACAQACPTEAIVFGDLNDPNSRVAQLKREPTDYSLLPELNTRPRTTYLATIKNPNPEIKG